MASSTLNLPEKSIEWLQDLIQINLDSRDGFNEAADNLKTMTDKNPAIESMFRKLAAERGHQAGELQAMVANNAESPAKTGSASAAVHRAWMDLRAALGGGEHAVLSEAERGEDHIKAKYQEALQELGTCPCTTTLRKHFAAVQASHDRVRDLRDRPKA